MVAEGCSLTVRRLRGLAVSVVVAAVAPLLAWGAEAALYDGRSGGPVTLEEALQRVRPGQVVIVTEEHDIRRHHDNQLAVLQVLLRRGLRISTGMEFLEYPDQIWVDRYAAGRMAEAEFLRAVRWGGYPFEWYRPLVLFPRSAGGRALALNAPSFLSRALAQRGVEGLTGEERSWLPPGFQLGNALYFERFALDVRQHGDLSEEMVRRFFAAQSAWDDTMAWQSVEYLRAHPEQVLVIVVGDFHASYGGGLPDRLRARGAGPVLVISQVSADGLTAEDVARVVAPDPHHGARADVVWVTVQTPP